MTFGTDLKDEIIAQSPISFTASFAQSKLVITSSQSYGSRRTGIKRFAKLFVNIPSPPVPACTIVEVTGSMASERTFMLVKPVKLFCGDSLRFAFGQTLRTPLRKILEQGVEFE